MVLRRLRSRPADDFESVEVQLRFWLNLSHTLIALGLFGFILVRRIGLADYFGGTDWQVLVLQAVTFSEAFWRNVVPYLQNEGNLVLLAAATLIWYLRYSHAVRNEMNVLVRLYSKFNPPGNWQSLVGSRIVPALSIGITLAFLALAYCVDRLPLYCLVMLVLSVMDVRGNSMLRRNLTEHFADARYQPLERDFYREFIMRRRAVATQYWIYRPQIERIGMVMIATVLAFSVSFSEQLFSFAVSDWVPYLIIVATIVGNEVTMATWRKHRDRDLLAIECDELEAERVRDGAEAKTADDRGNAPADAPVAS